jgi:GNAT superfamily N-acetyltransferase
MFCDMALAQRIDAVEARLVSAIVDHVGREAPALGAWREDVAGGTALFAGAGNPVNKVIGVGFEAPPSSADLDRLETRFHGAGVPVRIEMSTLARAESHTALSARGYRLLGFENVLARPIDATAEPATEVGIDVRPVDAAMLDPWLRAVVEGFAVPDESGAGGDEPLPPADALLGLFRHVFTAPGYQRYVALLDGAIAGGAIAWFDGDVAFLGGAATVPASRRRGVQRALFEARLRDAWQAGCSLAVLGTQPGTTSQRNAQRRGFCLLYARAVWNCAPSSSDDLR